MNRREKKARLYRHQEECLAFFRGARRLVNLSEYGTGKTPPTVARLVDLVPPHRALIVATAAMIGTKERPGSWERNLRMFGRPEWKLSYLVGRRAERWRALARPHHIALANYEAVLVMGSGLLGQYDVVVLDELHRLKNPASKISRAWAAFSEQMDYAYGLTGSPLLESPIDLYGVFRAIHPELFGPSFYQWRSKFFEKRSEVDAEGNRTFPKWYARPNAMEDLGAAVSAVSFRRTQAELPFDWPREVNADPIQVELAPEVRAVYRRLESQLNVSLATGSVTVDNIRPRLQKLCQLTSGWMYDARHNPIQIGRSTKAEAFADLYDEIHRTGPVVVWAVTPPDMALIQAALARFGPAARYASVYGRTSARGRADAVERFNGGHLNVLIAHPTCLGEGIDLVAAFDVRFSRTWSAMQYSQSRGRCRRINSRIRSVRYVEIVAKNTVDEGIMVSLKRKLGFLRTILRLGSVTKADRALARITDDEAALLGAKISFDADPEPVDDGAAARAITAPATPTATGSASSGSTVGGLFTSL